MKEKDIRSVIARTALDLVDTKEGDVTHKYIVDSYNSLDPLPRNYHASYKDPWCAIFASYVYKQSHIDRWLDLECSCNNLIRNAMLSGWWVEDDTHVPGVGDLVLYDWQDNGIGDNLGQADHVGIVVDVDMQMGYFVVVEGNKNHAVGTRELEFGSKFIRGFICPDFANIAAILTEEEAADPDEMELAKKWAIDNKIFVGAPDGMYYWDDEITREQVALLLYRLFGGK